MYEYRSYTQSIFGRMKVRRIMTITQQIPTPRKPRLHEPASLIPEDIK